MPRVLVLDGHCSAALAFTRSLGRAGYWVAVGSARGVHAPARLSPYCHIGFDYPVTCVASTIGAIVTAKSKIEG